MVILNKKAQSTLEFAMLILVVVAALLVMQRYMNKAMQGRIRSSADEVGSQFDIAGSTVDSSGSSTRNQTETATTFTATTSQNQSGNEFTPQ